MLLFMVGKKMIFMQKLILSDILKHMKKQSKKGKD